MLPSNGEPLERPWLGLKRARQKLDSTYWTCWSVECQASSRTLLRAIGFGVLVMQQQPMPMHIVMELHSDDFAGSTFDAEPFQGKQPKKNRSLGCYYWPWWANQSDAPGEL